MNDNEGLYFVSRRHHESVHQPSTTLMSLGTFDVIDAAKRRALEFSHTGRTYIVHDGDRQFFIATNGVGRDEVRDL